MKAQIPLIAMLTGLVSFLGFIYRLFNPDLPNGLVWAIYILAACSGACGLYLANQKK